MKVMTKLQTYVLIIFAALSTATHADEHAWGARYLANAGVMIEQGDTKILFDPFFRSDFGQYDLMPQEIEAALFAGTPPWDGIDAVFISHHHGDHFDPAVVTSFLRRWPAVNLYAPQQAVEAMLALDDGPIEPLLDRIHGLELERDSVPARFEMDGLLVEAVRIAHGGWPNRHANVENIVFRVTLDDETTVMHLGDADSARKHYVPHAAYWRERQSDLALVPVWLLLSENGRHVVDEHVDAGHAIGMHVQKSVPDNPDLRPPELQGFDIFTEPGETRRWGR